MFKNVFKIGMLAGLLALSCNVFAQEKTYAPEYPQYGFWSNWSLGVELGWGHQIGNGMAWIDGSNFGSVFSLEKELNHVWDFRLQGGTIGWVKHTNENCPDVENCPEGWDRFGFTTIGFKFGLIDAIKGYNPDRRGNLYLAADGGVEYYGHEKAYGQVGLVADLGLGYSYKVCKHSTLFAEATLYATGDINNPKSLFKGESRDYYSFIGLGYQYNFGPTAADLELIAQRALLSQENFDNLNAEINRLNTEVANSKQAEQRLQNNVNDLEDRIAAALRNQDNGKADSLAKVIDQIKADQLNYYALPFSILYAVDQWRIPSDQMGKVKAIARVIKDTDARFKVVGFCDKSGSDAYNMKLSEKRANELKRVLVEKYGIAEDRIDVDYKGKGMAFGDIEFSVNRRTSVYRVIE